MICSVYVHELRKCIYRSTIYSSVSSRSKISLTTIDCLRGQPRPIQRGRLPHPFISFAPAPPGRCSPAARLPPRASAMGAPAPSPRRPWRPWRAGHGPHPPPLHPAAARRPAAARSGPPWPRVRDAAPHARPPPRPLLRHGLARPPRGACRGAAAAPAPARVEGGGGARRRGSASSSPSHCAAPPLAWPAGRAARGGPEPRRAARPHGRGGARAGPGRRPAG